MLRNYKKIQIVFSQSNSAQKGSILCFSGQSWQGGALVTITVFGNKHESQSDRPHRYPRGGQKRNSEDVQGYAEGTGMRYIIKGYKGQFGRVLLLQSTRALAIKKSQSRGCRPRVWTYCLHGPLLIVIITWSLVIYIYICINYLNRGLGVTHSPSLHEPAWLWKLVA